MVITIVKIVIVPFYTCLHFKYPETHVHILCYALNMNDTP
jgi:hypothetical protein